MSFSWFKETGGLHSVHDLGVPTSLFGFPLITAKRWFEDALRFEDVYRKSTQLCFIEIRVESFVWIGEILSIEVSRVVCVRESEEGGGWGPWRGAYHRGSLGKEWWQFLGG